MCNQNDMRGFQPSDTLICTDSTPSHSLQGKLVRYDKYVVDDCSDGFVVLVSVATGEVVKGEWHESRFVLADGVE